MFVVFLVPNFPISLARILNLSLIPASQGFKYVGKNSQIF